MTLLGLAALHIALLAGFKWSAAADWNTLIPFIYADFALILSVIYLIYRWRYGVPAELFSEPTPRYADESNYPIN